MITTMTTPPSPWWGRVFTPWGLLIPVYGFWLVLVSRDLWLGAPLLALAWLASHVGGDIHTLILAGVAKPHQPHAVSQWPVWSWQNLRAWYQPSIAAQWHHIWHDPTLAAQTRNALYTLVALIVALWLQRLLRQHPQPEIAASTTHGSAHQATHQEIAPFLRPGALPDGRSWVAAIAQHLPGSSVARVRQWGQTYTATRPRPLTYLPIGSYRGRALVLSPKLQEEHLLLIAPTGSGKTTRLVAPAILSEQGGRSLYIPDPKSELWRLTSGAIAQHHQVWRFAPATPAQSMGYNPLAYVTDRRSARKLADCFLRNTGGVNEKDLFWNNLATSLIIGVISHLHATESHAPFSRLIEWFTTMPLTEFAVLLRNSPSADAQARSRTLIEALQKNEKIAAGVMSDLAARWDHLKTEEVYRVTSRNDLDFAQMTEASIALYVSIAARDAESFQFLSACLVSQMFDTFTRIADDHGGILPHAVMCYMDEFTNQGVIAQIGTHISTLRSARVGMLIAAQSYAQIRQVYGDDILAAIQENCNTHMTLPGAGLEVCKYLSERIGDTTIANRSASTGISGGPRGESHNASTSETRRRLILPEEIRTMPAGHALIVCNRLPPVVTRLYAYYETPLARRATLPTPPISAVPEPQEPPTAPTAPNDNGAAKPATPQLEEEGPEDEGRNEPII